MPGLQSRRALAGLTLAAACLVGSTCRQQEPAPLHVVVGVHSAPLSLDPHRRNEAATFSALGNIYEGLTTFDARGIIQPALAASWENPDELTWRFHLRPDVVFHDGRPLTAADVVASLQRARNHAQSDFSSYLVEVAEVRESGPLSVDLVTARPYAILLNKLVFVLVTPSGTGGEVTAPVGTGPYRFGGLADDGVLELEAFEGYRDGPPPADRITLLPVGDPTERIRRLRAGELDIAVELSATLAGVLAGDPCCRVETGGSLLIHYLRPRLDLPPFDDRRVRLALHLALDRDLLVQEMLHGYGRAAAQMVGPNVFGFDPALAPVTADRDEARRLLAAAGHPQGFEIPIQFREGREVGPIARQLAEVGIRLQPEKLPWSTLYQRLEAGDFTLVYGGVVTPSADASDFFDSMAHSRDPTRGYGQNNFARYSNPELDELIQVTGSALNMLGRRALLQQAMGMVMADLAFIPIFEPFPLYGVRHDVDWQPRLDGFFRGIEAQRSEPGRRPSGRLEATGSR